MTNKFIRDVKEVIRRLRNRGISFDGNRQYPAIPTIDNSVESHTNALRAIREAIETHERRNSKASLDSFVRLYELEDVLGGFQPGESSASGGGNYIGQNLGSGSQVYKETDQAPDPRIHKFRTVVGEDGVEVTQDDTHVIVGLSPGAFPGSKPAVTDVGAVALSCGSVTYLTPATHLPAQQVGDLMVWICITNAINGGGATLTPSPGWQPFHDPIYYANMEFQFFVHVYWKFATAADLDPGTTHSVTLNVGGTVCSYAYSFRNAHKEMPLTGLWRNTPNGYYQPTPGISTSQPIIQIAKNLAATALPDAWPGGTPDLGRPPTQEFYKRIGSVPGQSLYFHIGMRVGSIADDENWIPGEVPTSSTQGAGWVNFGATFNGMTGSSARWVANVNGGVPMRHYIEYPVSLVAGRKYIFALNHYYEPFNYSSSNEAIGVGYVDPSNNERMRSMRVLSSGQSHLDPLGDYGTVWFAEGYDGMNGGVPSPGGYRRIIRFTAQETGVHKMRISFLANDSTNTYTTFVGGGNENWYINSVVFREGWLQPVRTYTPDGPVFNGTANGLIHGWGWSSPGWNNWTQQYGFAVNPAWAELPLAEMKGWGNAPWQAASAQNVENGFIDFDGLTLIPNMTAGSAASHAGATRSVYPILYSIRRRYYFEISSLDGGGGIFGYSSNGRTGNNSDGQWTEWNLWDHYVDWPDGTRTTPATPAGVSVNDVFGFEIDFTDAANFTWRIYKNGVLGATKTMTASAYWNPLQPWTAYVIYRRTYPFSGGKWRVNLAGPHAYLPSGCLPYDAIGVADTPIVSGVGSSGTGVSLVGGTTENPTIKTLIEGTAIDITDNGLDVTITFDPTEVPNDSFPFSKLQNIATAKLLGRITAGSGDIEEIGLGAGLTFSGGNLVNTGASPTTTEGDLIVRGPSGDIRVPIGVTGQVLKVNTAATGKVEWGAGGGGGGGTIYVYELPGEQVLLQHFDGANNATSDDDVQGRTWSQFGSGSVISTAQSRFGGSSLYVSGAAPSGFAPPVNSVSFGNDFLIELRVFITSFGSGSDQVILIGNVDSAYDTGSDREWQFWLNNSTTIRFYTGQRGYNDQQYSATIPALALNTWHHVAVGRVGGTIYFWVNGTRYTSGASSVVIQHATKPWRVGYSTTSNATGTGTYYIDELRVIANGCPYANKSTITVPNTPHNDIYATDPITVGALGNKDPDFPPIAPDQMDDEFNGTSLAAKWAWRNQGGATATFDQGHLKLKAPAGTTQNTRNIEQTVSGSFKVRSKCAVMCTNVVNYLSAGMSIWDSASGKGFIFCFFVDFGNAYRLMVCRMNSATSFGTAPYKGDFWNGVTRQFLSPLYLEIEYDGSTIYFRVSDTGVNDTFHTIHSETIGTFLGAAPDRVGLFANSENSTDVYLLCDWFRKINAGYDVVRIGGGSSALPVGGTTGQALVKASDIDGDVEWGDAVGGVGTALTHVDAPPVVPDSMDDEFEGSTLGSAWAWLNQGGATASVSNGCLNISLPDDASLSLRGLIRAVPSGNWKIRAKVACRYAATGASAVGMIIVETSGNKNFQFARGWAGGSPNWQVAYYSNLTTYGGYQPYLANLSAYMDHYDWNYQEIEYDGTYYYFRLSADGVNFFTVATVTAASYFTATHIGFGGLSDSDAPAGYVSVDWFRRIGTGYTPGKFAANAQLQPSTVPVSPDTKPATPNALDDEFEGTSLDSKWTFYAGNSTGVTFRQGCLVGTNSTFWIEQPISGNFRVAAKLWCGKWFTANNQGIAMYVKRSATGAAYDWGMYRDGSGSNKWVVDRLNNGPAWVAQDWTSVMSDAWLFALHPWYVEIEYDGTNLYFRRSLTGHFNGFHQEWSVAVASHLGGAPDRVGITMSSHPGGLIDWFRRLA